MQRNDSTIKNKNISNKKSSNSNNVNLPIIDTTKRGQTKNNKINNLNPENSTMSLLSQSTIKTKSMSGSNIFEEKIKLKSTNEKINDIINNVNKNHNINTKIINSGIEHKNNNIIIPVNKNKINLNTNKMNIPKIRNIVNKPKYKFKQKSKINIKIEEEASPKIDKEKSAPRISKEKLKEIQEKRKKRLIEQTKEYENQRKIFEEMKENKNLNVYKRPEIIISNKINSPCEISQNQAQRILQEGGMIDAYKHLIAYFCKNGLPSGSLYDHASDIIRNYEKEWKKKKSKMLNEKIDKYFEDKKKRYLNIENSLNLNKSNINLTYKILKSREQEQFVKKLDKSRSTLNVLKKMTEIPNILKKMNEMEKEKESANKEKKIKIFNKLNTNHIEKNINNIANNNNNTNNNENRQNNKENNYNINNNDKEKKFIKQSLNDKKVYFNIKLKKNNEEEKIKESNEINNNEKKNDNIIEVTMNNTNDNENKTKSKKKDNEENNKNNR